jgi:hypothetical protein
MKPLITLLLLWALCSCVVVAPPPSTPENMQFAVTVTGGEGSTPAGEGTDFDAPWALAMQFTAERDDWPVGVEIGFQFGSANGRTATENRDLDLTDFSFGATKQWTVIPHLSLVTGAGLRIANATLLGPGWIFDTEIDDDYSIGYYVHAGAWWMFHQSLGVGLDARYADGSDYRLVGESVDSASTQLLLGLRWAF